MKIGLVGLENAGKTTLFNLLTGIKGESHHTGSSEIGVVNVPDERLDFIYNVYKPAKKVYTHIEFYKVPSITKESEETKKALLSVKEADIIALVIRKFKDENIYHPLGNIDMKRDFNIIIDELILADLYIIETRLERIETQLKSRKEETLLKEKELMLKLKEQLEKNQMLNTIQFSEQEQKILRGYNFLTLKPIFAIINCDEEDLQKEFELPLNIKKINISIKIESELIALNESERQEYLNLLGVNEPGINRLIKISYSCGNLITFFTINEKEARSWAIKKGTTALKAAGVIHSDFEKGFIRAEVIHFDDFKKAGSEQEARKQGLYRLEGKDYIVQDGDIIKFRFNV